MKDHNTNEDIYCEALAETLHHVALPVTVGFYAPWGRNKRSLLDKVKGALTRRSEERKDGKGGGGSGTSLLSLVWRVIFYLPVFDSLSSERVRYIFISFDAWEYVGCDHTWAGLVTTLLDEIEEKNKILFMVMKNVLFTMRMKLQKDMNRKDLSAQLGFMHSVKEEVKATIHFLRLMALREDREIRVVLKITSLDLCTPDKVVAVLDAINILLCDPNAPFISILAADPSILVECIQWSSNTCSNGYLYLDRIISLPFSLPRMSPMAKSQLLKGILKNQMKGGSTVNPGEGHHAESRNKGRVLTRKEIEQISHYLCHENFDAYFPGNSVQMKRVVNTVLTVWTMIKMGFRPKGGHQRNGTDERERIEEMIDWVVLANCWPCRLSWILQCVEDDQQRSILEESQRRACQDSVGNAEGHPQGRISERNGRGLLDVYEANAWDLDRMKYNLRKLLELDGDPDLFRTFLQKSHFTVGRARYFSDLLLNLDFSLKRRFELLRGLSRIAREKERVDLLPVRNTETYGQVQDN
ncbi:PREDICTED: NTPase KAP family P-loop domain-containing protein 1-like [Gekko japonicus]|uniref:NTPase KAP family P-loop domain-containing protein 1-like n=1 Tax=Gekko japonicus TaxID=146911 RepID=A0ABM1L0V8_GEKJA|nr:PREDICTED: NTPase KAP family P-loop domain-containing protein 1-like [Gekko japonicus]